MQNQSKNHSTETTAISVNYHTESLLAGLHASLSWQDTVAELIVVDNSGTVSRSVPTTRSHPPIRMLSPGENLGYAAAVNRALEHTRTRWVLLLNPDARLCPNALERLRETAAGTRTPLCGPRFYWDDPRHFRMPPAPGDHPSLATAFEAAGHQRIESTLLDHTWQIRHQHFWRQTQAFPEPFLSGACLLLDLDWFEKTGEPVFDERFFLYYEDTDLCLRLLQRGIFPRVAPAAEAIHYFDQSPDPSTGKAELLARARRQYYRKHFRDLPPPLPLDSDPSPAPPDLGERSDPPVFAVAASDSPVYLELALNPWFVPFIQTQVTGTEYLLPAPVWRRLAPGRYFARTRDPAGEVSGRWSWAKVQNKSPSPMV
ncbi:MAG: glycosyltransferase family 2 protein [Methylohalobius sp. ZOD2]